MVVIAFMTQYSLQKALHTNNTEIPFDKIVSEAIIVFTKEYKPVFLSSFAQNLLVLQPEVGIDDFWAETRNLTLDKNGVIQTLRTIIEGLEENKEE